MLTGDSEATATEIAYESGVIYHKDQENVFTVPEADRIEELNANLKGIINQMKKRKRENKEVALVISGQAFQKL